MLHIITPLYRFELIDLVYKTIPKFPDIKWHISISQRRQLPNNAFFSTDDRVVIYYLDCEDEDTVSKRNKIFENIKDGYFCLLDDDTKFLSGAYNIYKYYSKINFQGMIIGKQYRRTFNQIANRPFSDPIHNNLDTGMVIAHYSVLKHVKYEWSLSFSRDYLFWSNCYRYFKDENTISINKYISYYNYFARDRPYMVIRENIFNLKIEYDIYHKPILYLYIVLKYFKNFLERIKLLNK